MNVARIRGSRRRLDSLRADGRPRCGLGHGDAFFDLLSPASARALEISCGEGRVSRKTSLPRFDVTGLDVAPTLVDAAPHAADVPHADVPEDAARCRSTTAISRALEASGLRTEALREPALPGVGGHRRARMPLFLVWRAVRVASRG